MFNNNKNNFEEMFKKEFKKTHKVDIKINDFIEEKTTTKKQVSISWKYATVFTIFLLVLSTCILGFRLANQKDDFFDDEKFKYIYIEDDSEILKEDDVNQIIKICTGAFQRNNAYYIDINSDISLYIYKGVASSLFVDSQDQTEVIHQNIYFYAFKFKDETKSFNLLIDGVVININSENNFGILGNINQSEEVSIKFDIVYNNKVKSYNFTETE